MADKSIIQQKIIGCLLGSLLGDCLGAPYEFTKPKKPLQQFFEQCQQKQGQGEYEYTDDTAMTLDTAESLLKNQPVDYKHMARTFTETYFAEPDRGYSYNVGEVFQKLLDTKYKDIYKPAMEQFNGSGSYGNGGAMRVAPLALYFQGDSEATTDSVVKATKITHTNLLGVNGALLQAFAIQQSLREETLDQERFIEGLIERIKEFEGDSEYKGVSKPFQAQLKSVLKLLKNDSEVTNADVVKQLGNEVTAIRSVPTAIYCFLRAQREIPSVETDNPFRRAVQYAISLGGDTDTIASMAGAISGAYHGESIINRNLLSQCEDSEKVKKLADNLYYSMIQRSQSKM